MAKYKNIKVVYNGIQFDSLKEANRYKLLVVLQKNGEIENLEIQPVFVLAPPVVLNGRKKPAIRYRADFKYKRNGQWIVEDVKGFKTAIYKLKKHLMMSVYGIEIVEI